MHVPPTVGSHHQTSTATPCIEPVQSKIIHLITISRKTSMRPVHSLHNISCETKTAHIIAERNLSSKSMGNTCRPWVTVPAPPRMTRLGWTPSITGSISSSKSYAFSSHGSQHHSHTFPLISYRPNPLAFFSPTRCVSLQRFHADTMPTHISFFGCFGRAKQLHQHRCYQNTGVALHLWHNIPTPLPSKDDSHWRNDSTRLFVTKPSYF